MTGENRDSDTAGSLGRHAFRYKKGVIPGSSAIQRVSVIFQQKRFATYLVRVLNGSTNRVRGKGTRGQQGRNREEGDSARRQFHDGVLFLWFELLLCLFRDCKMFMRQVLSFCVDLEEERRLLTLKMC